MIKKLLYILFAGAVLAGVWLYTNYNAEKPAVTNIQSSLKVIAEDFSISPASAHDNSSVWFGLSNGKLMRYDLSKNNVTEYPVNYVEQKIFTKILWPIIGKDLILVSAQENKRFFHYYNEAEKKVTSLPSNVLEVDWLNDGRRVVMVWRSNEGKIQLVTSNADGSGYRVVRDLPWGDLMPVASPLNDKALLVRSEVSGSLNKIYEFDLNTGDYIEIVPDGLSTGAVWSPLGNKFAYTQQEGVRSKVFVYDMASKQSIPIPFETTIDKIAFSKDGMSLVAAVSPVKGQAEEIVTLNLDSMQSNTLLILPENLKARNLVPIGKKVYFLGVSDNKLYGIE